MRDLARDLRLALVEASEGKVGSPVDQVLLLCFRYDATTGKYTLAVMKLAEDKNRLLMQLTADITDREVDVAASNQAPAVGAAMYGAVAAGQARGGYDSIDAAVAAMARPHARTYVPDPASVGLYARLHDDYRALHDYFGRGGNDVMKRLRAIQEEVVGTGGELAPAPVETTVA